MNISTSLRIPKFRIGMPFLRLQAAITSGQPGVVERQNVVDAAQKEFLFRLSSVSVLAGCQQVYGKDIGNTCRCNKKARPEE